MVKLAMIGLGGMGKHHSLALKKVRGAQVVAGVDPLAKARKAYNALYPKVALYKDHKTMLKEADIDAVLVCTPTLDHAAITIDCLRSGRPVLTEKPMARTVADCRRMNVAADKTGQLLMVAHCRRFDKDWGRFAQIVRKGQLGRPLLWRSVAASEGPGGWFMDAQRGGGPLIDGAIHNYDFANYLFGEPKSVVASGIALTKRSAVDTASAVVRYVSGDQLLVSWAWGPRGDGAHDVLGPKASLLFGPGDMKPEGEEGYAYYRLWANGKNQKLIKFKYDFMPMYTAEDQHFINCITGKAKVCEASGMEGIKGVAVAEAIFKAAAGNGTAKVKW